MAKDIPNIPNQPKAKEPAEVLKEEMGGPPPRPTPTLAEIAATDPVMAALLGEINSLRTEVAKLRAGQPQPVVALASGAVEIPLPPEDTGPKEGEVRKKYKVGLPHGKDAIFTLDHNPVEDGLALRDKLIRMYNKHFGIIATEHQHQVEDYH